MKWSNEHPYSDEEVIRTVLVIRQAGYALSRERMQARRFLVAVIVLLMFVALIVRFVA